MTGSSESQLGQKWQRQSYMLRTNNMSNLNDGSSPNLDIGCESHHCHKNFWHLKIITNNINKLKNKKSPGFDNIYPKMVKELPIKGFLLMITCIFNAILRLDCWSNQFKKSAIKLIIKKTNFIALVNQYPLFLSYLNRLKDFYYRIYWTNLTFPRSSIWIFAKTILLFSNATRFCNKVKQANFKGFIAKIRLILPSTWSNPGIITYHW